MTRRRKNPGRKAAAEPRAAVKVGAEVRRRRLDLGLTLEGLAAIVGLTPNYIGTIENGKRDPSLSSLAALAKGLGVSVGELFGPVQTLSETAMEMAGMFDNASSGMQAALLGILNVIAKPNRI